MDNTWVTVNQAIELTQKGRTTITRLCNKYVDTKHIREEKGRFMISESFLTNHYSLNSKTPKNTQKDTHVVPMGTTWVSEQLKVKDVQITHLNGLLVESNERLKESGERLKEASTRLNESHVIIQTLQTKIALPEPKKEEEKEEKAAYSQWVLIALSVLIGGLLAYLIFF